MKNKYLRDGRISLHLLVIPLWILFYIIIASIDLSFISEAIDFDSDHIISIASGASSGMKDKSYNNTALFFSYIPAVLLQPFIILLGIITLIFLMKDLRDPKSLAIAAYISIPCILFILVRPQKETIVVLLSILGLSIFRSRLSFKLKIALVLLVYGLYAHLFRSYYFVIIAVFIALLVFRYTNPMMKIGLTIIGLGFLLVIPNNIFLEIQGTRDAVNYLRMAVGDVGSRSAFSNLFYPDNALAFIGNYIYAFFKLNFAPLFYPGIREFYLLSITLIYGWLLYACIKSKDKINLLCATMLIAHFMVYWLFEPDLGSYMRHFSSVCLYLVPILISLDGRKKYENTLSS